LAAGNQRTAVVTGAAQGLGEAIACTLHAKGYSVVLADVNYDRAQSVAAKLGERAQAAELDVRDRASFERLIASLETVDVLVNNAARTVARPLFEIEQEEWDDVLAVNLRSVLFGCQLAGERMREQQSGRIVNMASLAGQHGGLVAGAHYAASKAGIIVLTKIVAQELAPHGVTCNAVAPAAILTPAMDSMPPDRLEVARSRIPVGRFGDVQEVASLVLWLCSPDAGFTTGATYDVNGGISMR
jgi:3-oxoacyl-[acyl-carrier protein] reductase